MIDYAELKIELTELTKKAIKDYKENGNENGNAFSIDAVYEDGELSVCCDFHDDLGMTIMYWEGTDNATVKKIFDLDSKEIDHVVSALIDENFIVGLDEQ